MSTIDFTPTAYTVKSPGNGQSIRYEGEAWKHDLNEGRRWFESLAANYPALAPFVVPDHFVQEYCRGCDSSYYSGSTYRGEEALFLKLANRGAAQTRFS